MTRKIVGVWLALALCLGLLSQGCQQAEQATPMPLSHVTALPAGGVYRAWPAQIQLQTASDANIFYQWEGETEQRYTTPIPVPVAQQSYRTLLAWTQDARGKRSRPRREHYVLAPAVPPLELFGIDRPMLGARETAVLRWRSTAPDATYEVALTRSGWGPGRRLAQGAVVPGAEQRTPLDSARFYPGENRLWLRVSNTAGAQAATSLLVTAYTTPATTSAWPGRGVFGQRQTVRLFTDRPATIYYTTDGSLPTKNATPYIEPVTIERSTLLRYRSIDAYGNEERPHQERYTMEPRAPTVILQAISGEGLESEEPLVLTWHSDMAGRYEVTLHHLHEQRQITVRQGRVKQNDTVRSSMARNFLTGGGWRLQVQVQPPAGPAGSVSLRLRTQYHETFATTRYLDTEATTAAWDTTQRRARLTRGPREISRYPTRGRSRRVTGRDAHAYLANSKGGLHIVDISDPQQPQRAGVFYPHGKAVALATYGSYVYVAASGSGLTVFDVSQPTAPRLVAIVPVRGSAAAITIAAPYAYVGTSQGTLSILDLTTPLQPRQLGQIAVGGRIVDIIARDGVIYVACFKHGVALVDVREPAQPRVLSRWSTAAAATAVALHDKRLYVAADNLEVLDVQNLAAPRLLWTVRLRGAYGVTLLPPYILVAAGTNGLQVIAMDRRMPSTQQQTAHYAARIALNGAQALVADTKGGLRLLDVSQPETPRLVGTLDEIGPIVDVVVDGAIAYLATTQQGSGLVVADISEPTTPRVLARYHNEAVTDVVLWEDLALVSDAAGAIYVVDVHQPHQPRLRGWLPLPGKPQRLALRPPYVLVASDAAGVHVVDVSHAEQPQHLTTVSMPGRALDIALLDDTAYIAAVEGGIQTLDLSTPQTPALGPSYQHEDRKGDHLIRVMAHQEGLYAIDSQRGLQRLQRSRDGYLQLRGDFQIPSGAPWGFTAVGPFLFVTTLLNSLYVLDVAEPTQPRLLSTAPYGGAALHAINHTLAIAVRGRRGVPGGLRLVGAFAAVPQTAFAPLQAQGAVALPGDEAHTLWVNRAYTWNAPGIVQSIAISPSEIPIHTALLWAEDFWGATGRIRYELSNNGGIQWHPVQPGEPFRFPAAGTELRWRAILLSTDFVTTPTIEMVSIAYTTAEPAAQ